MAELKPCPFCGSPAEFTGECDMVWCRCSNHNCGCQLVTRFDEPEEAAEVWNKRADQHIADLLQAESKGRLIVLPCKVGDTVWTRAQGIITHATVTRVKSPEITMRLDEFGYGQIRNTDGFGQILFTTREEAEAALGGESHDDNIR